jgi:ABC-2 type transport system ATP-binding protein
MIEFKGLQKVIGTRTVIDIGTFEVAATQVAALVGPEGSGKSTLLDLLTGKLRPTAGELRLDGLDPFEQKRELARRVGVLFLEDCLYKNQSPRANLQFHCRLYGLPRQRADEVLAQVGLADQANARLDKLPSGLLRRLAFGRALLHRPAILLAVEPFARCDEASIALLSGIISRQADEGGAVLILAADDARLAELCDTLYVLNQGRIIESRQPRQENQKAFPFKIPVRLESKVALVNPADILYVQAEGDSAVLYTVEARMPTQFTLSELETRLARSGFFRAHRGYLVNLQHAKEVIPYTRNSFSLILNDADETEIPLSKSAARELRELLGY